MKNLKWIFITFFILSIVSRANAKVTVPEEMRNLPPMIVKWWIYQTSYLSREVDATKLEYPGEQSDLDPFYAPEGKNVFDLEAYWIPVEKMELFQTTVPKEMRRLVLRKGESGREEVLLFVHPLSKDLYPEFINGQFEKEIFKAAATSSTRSLLVWKPGFENAPFIVSLNVEIAGLLRNIEGVEIALSHETSKILHQTPMPAGAGYMDEVLGTLPKGSETGGQILRVFPKKMLSGESTFASLFSLYGGSKSVQEGSLLKELIKKSGLSPLDYFRFEILRPFVKVWIAMALRGITMEAHAQNVMIEIKTNSTVGEFEFLDFGGFDIDKNFRSSVGLYVPEDMNGGVKYEDTSGIFTVEHEKFLIKSLARYFQAGFLYNVRALYQKWRMEKVFPIPKMDRDWARKMLVEELQTELANHFGHSVKVRADFRNLGQLIQQARRSMAAHGQCQGLFR